MNKYFGFTLLELMITLAIIGILSAVALPQYDAYRNKQIRADAVRSMMKISLELERCRSQNGDGSYRACPAVQNIIISQKQHYSISTRLNNNNLNYLMTATKVGNIDSDCNTLTLTHDGLRDANSSNGALNTTIKRIQRCWSS